MENYRGSPIFVQRFSTIKIAYYWPFYKLIWSHCRQIDLTNILGHFLAGNLSFPTLTIKFAALKNFCAPVQIHSLSQLPPFHRCKPKMNYVLGSPCSLVKSPHKRNFLKAFFQPFLAHLSLVEKNETDEECAFSDQGIIPTRVAGFFLTQYTKTGENILNCP
jgi:hypothetical protein